MTVRQLIQALEKFPDDKPVSLKGYWDGFDLYYGVGISTKHLTKQDTDGQSEGEHVVLEPL